LHVKVSRLETAYFADDAFRIKIPVGAMVHDYSEKGFGHQRPNIYMYEPGVDPFEAAANGLFRKLVLGRMIIGLNVAVLVLIATIAYEYFVRRRPRLTR
jgi:hypothetical protein